MIGYVVIGMIFLFLMLFTIFGIRRWRNSVKYPVTVAYVLVAAKRQKETAHGIEYLLCVQLREEEQWLIVPQSVYNRLAVPVRGKLTTQDGSFVAFEE